MRPTTFSHKKGAVPLFSPKYPVLPLAPVSRRGPVGGQVVLPRLSPSPPLRLRGPVPNSAFGAKRALILGVLSDDPGPVGSWSSGF